VRLGLLGVIWSCHPERRVAPYGSSPRQVGRESTEE